MMTTITPKTINATGIRSRIRITRIIVSMRSPFAWRISNNWWWLLGYWRICIFTGRWILIITWRCVFVTVLICYRFFHRYVFELAILVNKIVFFLIHDADISIVRCLTSIKKIEGKKSLSNHCYSLQKLINETT